MNDKLQKLLELSKLDKSIFQIKVRRNKLDEEIQSVKDNYESLKKNFAKASSAVKERQRVYKKEDANLKAEQEKLVARRKELGFLADYKLQSAAQREIEAASKQLSLQEDNIINMMTEIDTLESNLKEVQAKYQESEKEINEYNENSAASYQELDSEESDFRTKRNDVVKDIDKDVKRLYERLVHRHPQNPISPLKDTNCGTCYINLGPQILNQIHKSDDLTTCRACGRILYIEVEKED